MGGTGANPSAGYGRTSSWSMSSATFQEGLHCSEKLSFGVTRTVRKREGPDSPAWEDGAAEEEGAADGAASCVYVGWRFDGCCSLSMTGFLFEVGHERGARVRAQLAD